MIRRGMTLVEMLVALVATLMLMTAIAQAFSAFGGAISGSRAVLDLDSRMRIAAWRLRSDLAGVTARTLPPLGPDGGEGYFEIIEGPASDADTSVADGTTVGPADHDDVLLFTTRNTETPFIGRAPTNSSNVNLLVDNFESTIAEVAWFARPTPASSGPAMYTLYRRQLLVMGYVATSPFSTTDNTLPWNNAGANWAAYFNLPCDVSVRLEGSRLFPNSLADLSRREARFLHNPTGKVGGQGFPFRFASEDGNNSGTLDPGEDLNGNGVLDFDHQCSPPPPGLIFDPASPRQGEDVVLTNVIAFDVRVFDPAAAVYVTAANTPLVPGDQKYGVTMANNSGTACGAYVDLGYLGYNAALVSKFGGFGQVKSGLQGPRRTYDTWSLTYEANGLDEDGDGVPDEGTNGLDDDSDGDYDEPAYDANGDGVFEDLGETETLPPYPVPLRGIEVRIRCYEPSSRQVRQVTIRHSFL